MWNKILKILVLGTGLLFVSCRMDWSFIDGNQKDYEGSNNWMSQVADETLIRKMTIPGTHDTCANYDFMSLSSTAAAQDLSLKQQLEAGVRQIDIRMYNNGKEILIHHGITYQHMNYNQVLSICYDFLEKNPSETILFFIMAEYKSSDADICDGVMAGINANPEKWLTVNSAENLTLGQCRGKLVLVKRFNGIDGVGIPGGSGIGQLHQLNSAKTSNLEAYWNNLLEDLNKMESSENPAFSIVWSAGYFEGQYGIPNIRMTSSCINPKMDEYLSGKMHSHAHLGIIGMDHITKRLAYKIYSVNLD